MSAGRDSNSRSGMRNAQRKKARIARAERRQQRKAQRAEAARQYAAMRGWKPG